jgi:hypothetical protein
MKRATAAESEDAMSPAAGDDPMSEARVIRQATMGDAAELARLRWDSSPDDVAAGGQPFDAFAAGFAAFLDEALAGDAWAIWVAAGEGRLHGNLYLQTIAKVPRPGDFARRSGYVANVYVGPA